MKRILVTILAVAAISISANAQLERKTKGDRQMKEGREMGKHHKKHDMMKDLNLTDAQKQQFKANAQSYKQKMQDLSKNDNITVKQLRERKEALRKEQRTSMESILTSEQKAQLEKKKADRISKHKERDGKHFDKMKDKLNLTEDQAAKLKANRESFQSQYKAIKDNDALSPEARKEKMKALKAEQKSYMESILTPEQKEKMQAKKKHKKEKPASK